MRTVAGHHPLPLVTTALLALGLTACGASTPTVAMKVPALPSSIITTSSASGVTMTTESIKVGGLTRSYYLVRPKTIPSGKRLPMVVVLHGINATPEGESHRTGFLPLAMAGEAILLYPTGYKEAWNAGACCRNAGAPAHVNDVTFVTDVVRDVESTEPVDAKEVYLTGYSNGGKMAYRIACFDPTLFAGFGAGEAVAVSTCESVKPASFVEVDSTGDPEIAYSPSDPPVKENGFTELSATAQMNKFVSQDSCVDDPKRSAAGKMTTLEWSSCAGGQHVELATLSGGTHAWPDGAHPPTPSAEQVMWTFWTGRPFP